MLALAGLASADLMSDFSIANGNPNGSWTYGSKSTLTGSLTTFTSTWSGMFATAQIDGWYSGAGAQLPGVYKLMSGTIDGVNGGVGGVAVGEVSMHGGADGTLAVTRYTVGAAGLYNLSGYFKAGDGLGSSYGRVDAYVLHNNTTLFSSLNTAVTQTFGLSSVNLAAGDTIDVVVGIGEDQYFYDTTPVNLSVEAVPEPASLLALGGLALGLARRRRK